MRSKIPVSLSLLLLGLPGVWAQPADEFFHGGAQHYLTNNLPAALASVTNGLQRFPEDKKLKKLYELLNQQQQQQQNQQEQKDQQQEQKDQQDQEQQKKDEQKQEQAKNDQQKKDDDQKSKDSPDKKDQPKDQPGDKSKAKPDEKKEGGEPQPLTPHAMTPQEAKQLLDAQKGDEQVLQFRPQGEPKNQGKTLKDW